MTKLLPIILSAALLSGIGCSPKRKAEEPLVTKMKDGRFESYMTSLTEHSRGSNYYLKVIHLSHTTLTDEYDYVTGFYNSPTGKVDKIQVRKNIPPGVTKDFSKDDKFNSLYGSRDKTEFERLQALLEGADKEMRK